MAEVLFQKGTVAEYNAGAKDTDTLYHVVDSNGVNKFYLGELDLSATKAAEITVLDEAGNYDGTTVEAVLAEIASSLSGGVESKTVYCVTTAGSSSDPFSKKYSLYQGSEGSSESPVAAEKLIDIEIPKDMVVSEGVIRTITYDSSTDKLYDGEADVTELIKGEGGTATADDAGKYIRLTIANKTSDKVYISVKELVDLYTGGSNAEVTVVVDGSNVITATINKVSATKVIYQAADNTDPENPIPEVTVKAKIDAIEGEISTLSTDVDTRIGTAIAGLDASVSIEDAGNTNPLNITVTEVDGVLTGVTGSIDAETFDAFGSAATVKSEVIGESTDTKTSDTINGAKAYADDAVNTAIEGLDTAADVVIASKSGNTVTLKAGVSEANGVIAQGSGADITLADVAASGAASDVSLADVGGHTAEATVEGAIGELYTKLTWGAIPAAN